MNINDILKQESIQKILKEKNEILEMNGIKYSSRGQNLLKEMLYLESLESNG